MDKVKPIDLIFSFQRSQEWGSSYLMHSKLLGRNTTVRKAFHHITKWQDTDPLFISLLDLNIQTMHNVHKFASLLCEVFHRLKGVLHLAVSLFQVHCKHIMWKFNKLF